MPYLTCATGLAWRRRSCPRSSVATGAVATSGRASLMFSQRLYVIILYWDWTRAEARCRRPAGPGAADYVLADGLPAGFPGPRLPGAGDLILQLLEEPD